MQYYNIITQCNMYNLAERRYFKMNRISSSEMEIMEFLWTQPSGATLKQICDNFSSPKGWKQQTVRTFLVRLNNKQFLNIYIDKETRRYVYLPSMTKKEYLHRLSREFLEKNFNNSVYDFLLSFTGNEKLSEEEAQRLREFLDA